MARTGRDGVARRVPNVLAVSARRPPRDRLNLDVTLVPFSAARYPSEHFRSETSEFRLDAHSLSSKNKHWFKFRGFRLNRFFNCHVTAVCHRPVLFRSANFLCPSAIGCRTRGIYRKNNGCLNVVNPPFHKKKKESEELLIVIHTR